MTNPSSGSPPDTDRHGRRAVWITFFIAMTVAAFVYKAKAEDDRSAFIRWHHQLLELRNGTDIWEKYYFPTPPIMAISLAPLTILPPIEAAMVWYGFKVILASLCLVACMRMAVPPGYRFPWWAQGALILLSLRPILGDLHHANTNLIILSLVVATLVAWRRGYDVLAGMCLALAITYKITPALFLPYFLYKKSWKTVASTFVGIGLFLFVIPSLVLGVKFNWTCLTSWYRLILGPYVEKGVASPQEVNQSMVGVISRLTTDAKPAGLHGYAGLPDYLMERNLVSWSPQTVNWIVKGLSLVFVAMLPVFCRTKTQRRDDPRLLGEFALVVLTMLIVSERSWKHHFVTIVLPYTYLVARVAVLPGTKRLKRGLAGSLFLSAFLMACTSSEFGFVFGKHGHKIAQYYGLFLDAALVVYVVTAWRVMVELKTPLVEVKEGPKPVPPPHLEVAGAKALRV